MTWVVLFHDAFEAEFQLLAEGLQDELLAHAALLFEFGRILVDRQLMDSKARNTPT